MASKKKQEWSIKFSPAEIDDKEAAENMLRIYEQIFFFNSDTERFYKDLSDDNDANA